MNSWTAYLVTECLLILSYFDMKYYINYYTGIFEVYDWNIIAHPLDVSNQVNNFTGAMKNRLRHQRRIG